MLAFDVETCPLDSALTAPYNPDDHSPPTNYKNADAIERWHASNEEKWQEARIKECALSPRLGQVVAIAYADDNGERWVSSMDKFENEADILRVFWSTLKTSKDVCSWNGKGFDFPFLIGRSAILGVKPHLDVTRYLARYNHVPHFDLMLALAAGGRFEKMDLWATAMGTPPKLGNGGDVYGMVQRSEWDTLRAYAQRDADTLLEMAVRCAPFFGVTCAEMVPELSGV